MSAPIRIPMTPAQFAAKAAELKANGIDLSDWSGVIDHSGVTADYSFDGETLTVNVTKRPFLASESLVENKLRQFLAAK